MKNKTCSILVAAWLLMAIACGGRLSPAAEGQIPAPRPAADPNARDLTPWEADKLTDDGWDGLEEQLQALLEKRITIKSPPEGMTVSELLSAVSEQTGLDYVITEDAAAYRFHIHARNKAAVNVLQAVLDTANLDYDMDARRKMLSVYVPGPEENEEEEAVREADEPADEKIEQAEKEPAKAKAGNADPAPDNF